MGVSKNLPKIYCWDGFVSSKGVPRDLCVLAVTVKDARYKVISALRGWQDKAIAFGYTQKNKPRKYMTREKFIAERGEGAWKKCVK